MKKANLWFLLMIFLCFLTANVFAQTNPTNAERRVIEVTGSAETLVTPNEFTFKITLLERMENKQKLTIEMQEANLKRELTNLGVDVTNDLSIFDLNSFYIDRKKVKDTLASKDYRLKLNDLAKIERLQEIADRLNISRLDLIESTHTELTRFRRETKMEAVKAAKTKAEYMLGAIGEKVGKAVYVREIEDVNERKSFNFANGLFSNSSNNVVESQQSSTTLNFSKIKLRYEVLAKFEIE
ncbi:MAG TPA: SIMPL domain-containing protein [Pyrinomonadaceae bacterium]|nr:SIMPL domain-containing protein [Pyrinomonadaceae bacterium]